MLTNTDKINNMKKKPTKIVELVIEENNEMLAIDAISLVSAPAIEQDFVFFGKEKHNLTFAKVDEDKRMLVSPALIPNKQIFRYDPNTDSEYYVYFSKDTVRQAAELYLKHNNHHKATYEHQDRVSGVLTTESWIKEGDQDKSKMYGYDLPNGTWFVKMRIDNDDLWQKIKDGELKGLSIEGYFVDKMQKMSETQPTDQEILTALNEIIKESNKPQKVELGAIDDFEKLFNKSIDASVKIGTTFIDAVSKAQNKYKGNIANMEKALKVGSDIKKSAKELGIDLPKAVINKIDSAEANIKEEKGIISKLQKLYNLF
jgi:hypothetical protein